MKIRPAKEGLKWSVVVVSYNTAQDLTRCVESVCRHTKDFELIVVDNGSVDGSVGYLLGLFSEYRPGAMNGRVGENGMICEGRMKRGGADIPLKVVLNDRNRNFGPANNQGAALAEGERLALLNSDCVVTPKWAELLEKCMARDKKAAIVGPVSSCSAGRQHVGDIRNGRHLDDAAIAWVHEHGGKYEETGILFGWCMYLNRAFLDTQDFLFDERFANAFEDNDLCMRTHMAGWRMWIDFGTFVFHAGQRSFLNAFADDFVGRYERNGQENMLRFHEKWRTERRQKLIAVYRIANCEKYIRESMERTSEFADEIIVLLARSHDKTKEIALSFPKVTVWQEWKEPEHPFDEQAERDWLLQRAIERGADWVISIDGDEVYEKKFAGMARGLMSPADPQVQAYCYFWRTIWDRENGVEKYRADGIFGGFQNCRFFKVIPGMRIEENSNVYNHHCGSAPFIPGENVKWLNIRVKHLGYDTEEQRRRKHAFYKAADPRPVAADVGNDPGKEYTHLVDRNVTLKTYREKNDISVMVICRNEEQMIHRMLENVEPIADEYVIVDTGSTDGTLAEVERFARRYKKPVRIFEKKFECDEIGGLLNYSEAKNWAKLQCRGAWILNMDCDELFAPEDVHKLFNFVDEDVDGIMFTAVNYLEEPLGRKPEEVRFSLSETIRLYRNIPEIFYSGLIHESVEESISARMRRGIGLFVSSPVPIHHRGFLKPRPNIREKIDRYHRINERQFEVSGRTDARALFNIATHFMNEGKDAEAREHHARAIELDPQFWRSKQNLAFHDMHRAKMLLKDARKDMPQHFVKQGKIDEIVGFLDKFNMEVPKVG